jgi:carbon monoxide dehydrogenase subunit G
MTSIKSDKVQSANSPEAIFNFLCDFNNFKELMPEQVTNWQSSNEECSFTIAGMATLGMKLQEKNPFTSIKAVRNGQAPFDFTLTCFMHNCEGGSEVQLVLDADLNPMLKMMAERPLTNFLNILANKLKDYKC